MSPLATTEELDLEVELADASWAPINDVTGYSKSESTDTRSVRVHMRNLPHTRQLPSEYTIDVSGLVNTDDPGQMRIRAQRAAKLPVNIRVQPRGPQGGTPAPAGHTILCDIGGLTHESNADDPYQTWSFTLTAKADPVVVGAGPIL